MSTTSNNQSKTPNCPDLDANYPQKLIMMILVIISDFTLWSRSVGEKFWPTFVRDFAWVCRNTCTIPTDKYSESLINSVFDSEYRFRALWESLDIRVLQYEKMHFRVFWQLLSYWSLNVKSDWWRCSPLKCLNDWTLKWPTETKWNFKNSRVSDRSTHYVPSWTLANLFIICTPDLETGSNRFKTYCIYWGFEKLEIK